MAKSIIKSLNELNQDIDFVEAPSSVISNEPRAPEKSLMGGTSGVVLGKSPTGLNLAVPNLGNTIVEGYREEFGHCDIICKKIRRGLSLAVYDKKSRRPVSQAIHCEGVGKHGVDESCFIWLGSLATILTAWSDNDDPQCQVITLEILRTFARAYGAPRKKEKGKRRKRR